MNRARALIVSFAVAVAAIAGVFALTSTVSLNSQTRASTDRQVATRTAQLNRYEASLRKALAQKPPKLPAIPAAGPVRWCAVPRPCSRSQHLCPCRLPPPAAHRGRQAPRGVRRRGGGRAGSWVR